MLAIKALIPSDIVPETASNFFFAATGVNATLMVAMSITISTILERSPGQNRKPRMLLLVTELTVVFFGLIVSGVGILIFNSATPFDYVRFLDFVYIVFTTWVIGFVLLISGIWVSVWSEVEDSKR
jgi:hypothetical protein